MLLRCLFDDADRYSVRFLASVSGTAYLHGNSPHTVTEYLRKLGNCLEAQWPFEAALFDEFYGAIPPKIYQLAHAFLDQFTFQHDWLPNTQPDTLKDALRYSPIGISVYAWVPWVQGSDGLYIRPTGAEDNHFVSLCGYEDGVCWHVFDSYDQTHKKLAWNFGFESAKRYSIARANPQAELSKLQKILQLLMQVLQLDKIIAALKSAAPQNV